MWWSKTCEIRSFRSTDNRNGSDGKCAPEFLGDIILTCLRFESKIEFRCGEIETFTRRLSITFCCGMYSSIERIGIIRRDAFSKRDDGIDLPERMEFFQTCLRTTIGNKPERKRIFLLRLIDAQIIYQTA